MACRNCEDLDIDKGLCPTCTKAGLKIVKGTVVFPTKTETKPAKKKK